METLTLNIHTNAAESVDNFVWSTGATWAEIVTDRAEFLTGRPTMTIAFADPEAAIVALEAEAERLGEARRNDPALFCWIVTERHLTAVAATLRVAAA